MSCIFLVIVTIFCRKRLLIRFFLHGMQVIIWIIVV
jgi:hypothetical protein